MDVGMMFATIFSGVFGGLIGFVVIGFAMVALVLPYMLMNRKSQEPRKADTDWADR